LTIKLTRHVAAATCFFAEVRADNSPLFLSTIRSLEQICGLKSRRNSPRLASRRTASRFCQLLQLSKSFGPGYRPERPAPGGTSEKFRTEIKNPASSAGPIRLQTVRKRLRAMLDSVLSGIRS